MARPFDQANPGRLSRLAPPSTAAITHRYPVLSAMSYMYFWKGGTTTRPVDFPSPAAEACTCAAASVATAATAATEYFNISDELALANSFADELDAIEAQVEHLLNMLAKLRLQFGVNVGQVDHED